MKLRRAVIGVVATIPVVIVVAAAFLASMQQPTLTVLHAWQFPPGEYRTVALSPDGTTLLTTGDAGNLAKLWDATTGTLRATVDTGEYSINSIEFAADGRLLSAHLVDFDEQSGQVDRKSVIYHAETGEERPGPPDVDATPETPEPLPFEMDSDGVTVWDPQTDQQVARLEPLGLGQVTCAAMSPNGQFVVTGGDRPEDHGWEMVVPPGDRVELLRNEITLWNVRAPRRETHLINDSPVRFVAFINDEQAVAVLRDGTVILLRVGTWSPFE